MPDACTELPDAPVSNDAALVELLVLKLARKETTLQELQAEVRALRRSRDGLMVELGRWKRGEVR